MFKNFLFRWLVPVFFDADDKGGGGGTTPTPEEIAAEAKKKEQEELNQKFVERATRAADAERKKIMESLGVKDPDEALALIKSAKEAEEKNKTESEKLAAKATAAEEARDKAQTESKALLEEANRKLLDSEIKITSRTAVIEKDGKVTRPAFRKEAMEEVLLLIERTKIEEKEGVYTGVEKALSELAKAKPYLLEEKQQAARGTPRDGGSGARKQEDGERTPIIRSL